jgi:hypothetical protein
VSHECEDGVHPPEIPDEEALLQALLVDQRTWGAPTWTHNLQRSVYASPIAPDIPFKLLVLSVELPAEYLSHGGFNSTIHAQVTLKLFLSPMTLLINNCWVNRCFKYHRAVSRLEVISYTSHLLLSQFDQIGVAPFGCVSAYTHFMHHYVRNYDGGDYSVCWHANMSDLSPRIDKNGEHAKDLIELGITMRYQSGIIIDTTRGNDEHRFSIGNVETTTTATASSISDDSFTTLGDMLRSFMTTLTDGKRWGAVPVECVEYDFEHDVRFRDEKSDLATANNDFILKLDGNDDDKIVHAGNDDDFHVLLEDLESQFLPQIMKQRRLYSTELLNFVCWYTVTCTSRQMIVSLQYISLHMFVLLRYVLRLLSAHQNGITSSTSMISDRYHPAIEVYYLRIILVPRFAQQHIHLAELLLRSELDIAVWGEFWNQELWDQENDLWRQGYLPEHDDHMRYDCSIARDTLAIFGSWMRCLARDRNIRIIWGAINDSFGLFVLTTTTMVMTVTTACSVLMTMDVDDDPIAMRTKSDVNSSILGRVQAVDSTASDGLWKHGELAKRCNSLNMRFVGTVDAPVDNIFCVVRLQRLNIQDDSQIHPAISNASSFAPCSVHTHVAGLLDKPTLRLTFSTGNLAIGRHRTKSDHLPNWGEGCEEQDAMQDTTQDDERPYLCYSTHSCVLLRHEERHAAGHEVTRTAFEVTRTAFDHSCDKRTCLRFARADHVPTCATVETHPNDESMQDTDARLPKIVRHTDGCPSSERYGLNVNTTRHHWRFTLTWLPISTRLTLSDTPACNLDAGMMTMIDAKLGVTALRDLDDGSIHDRCCKSTIQRSTEAIDTDSSYGCTFDGCMTPTFTRYSDSDASSHRNLLNSTDRHDRICGRISQPYHMTIWVYSAKLNDDESRHLSWGASYRNHLNYESAYDILAHIDGISYSTVYSDFFCTCGNNGLIFDTDVGTMPYDTGADSTCLDADDTPNDNVVTDGNSYSHDTILDITFAADRGFIDTMVCRCADLFCDEKSSLKDAHFDVGTYDARTTLERTMIKSTSHRIEVLVQSQSMSSRYDGPTATENILFTRRRPTPIASMLDELLHRDMICFNDYLRKCHHILMHNGMNGNTAPCIADQRKLIALSIEFNYGCIPSKIWTSYQAIWMFLWPSIWRHGIMDLADMLSIGLDDLRIGLDLRVGLDLGVGLDSTLIRRGVTKETQLSLGTDSVLLWNLGISRMYMKIQNETKYVCHVMAPNDRFGGNLHTETREERFDLL